MRLIQCELMSGVTHMMCWLEPKVKVGDIVILVGDSREWAVIGVYRDSFTGPPERGWKVGGLA